VHLLKATSSNTDYPRRQQWVTGSRSAVGRYDREEQLERRGAVDLESPIKGKWRLPGSDESVAVHGDLYDDDDESTYLTTKTRHLLGNLMYHVAFCRRGLKGIGSECGGGRNWHSEYLWTTSRACESCSAFSSRG